MSNSPCKDCVNEWFTSTPFPPPPLNSLSCRLCYLYHWLWPSFQKELAKLKGGLTIGPIIPEPGPDPSPIINLAEIDRQWVQAVAGDPNPQPNIFSNKAKLQATLMFKKALDETLSHLEKSIKALQK